MKNRTALGGYEIQSGSHIAPGARCNNVIQLAGVVPLRLRHRLHGPDAGMTVHSIRSSMQTGTNPSLGLFASVFEGLRGEENAPHSFSSRAALKLSQVAQTVLDITCGLFIGFFAILYFLSPFIALFCLLSF